MPRSITSTRIDSPKISTNAIPLRHTQAPPASLFPSPTRPVRVVARDLEADELLRVHQHPWSQVTYALDGAIQVLANHQTWFVPPLRAIWIPSTIEHEVRTLEKARLRVIYVHTSVSPIVGEQCVVLEVSALMRELIRTLSDITGAIESSAREQHLVVTLLDELAIANNVPLNVPMPRDPRLCSLCKNLIANPSSTFTLHDFSTEVGASERTLSRLFQREVGMSFGLWRQQMRLARAAPLITGGMPISAVAAECGYASQSAFSAMFKRTFGQSPSTFFKPNFPREN